MEGTPNGIPVSTIHPVQSFHPDDDKKFGQEFVENPVATPLAYTQAPVEEPAYMQLNQGQTLRVFWRSTMFCMMAAAGAMFDAYALSVPQGLLANPGYVAQFATAELMGVPQLAPTTITLWGVCFTIGQLTGMISGGFISDKFGRKISMWLLALFLVADAVIGIFSKTWQVYCIARVCSGIASGLVQMAITVYIAENAPIKIRGAIIANYALFFAIGGLSGTICLNEIANYKPLEYKIAFYSEFIILALFLPCLLLAPESPMYYVRKGNEVKAKRSMRWLYGNVASYDIDTEYSKMVASFVEEQEAPSNSSHLRQYAECFRGTNLRRTIISLVPLTLQQFSGLVLFLGYSTYFFALAGYNKPFEASVIIQTILLVFIMLSFFIIDRVGRRNLLLFGTLIIVVCNFVLAGLGFVTPTNGPAMIFISCLWAAAYSSSLGPTAWTYLAETSSPSLRSKTAGLAAAISACFNLIWSYTIPIMLSPLAANLGLKCGFLYGSLSLLGTVVIFFFIPELKGRSYLELDEMFEAKLPTRKFKGYVSSVQTESTGNTPAQAASCTNSKA